MGTCRITWLPPPLLYIAVLTLWMTWFIKMKWWQCLKSAYRGQMWGRIYWLYNTSIQLYIHPRYQTYFSMVPQALERHLPYLQFLGNYMGEWLYFIFSLIRIYLCFHAHIHTHTTHACTYTTHTQHTMYTTYIYTTHNVHNVNIHITHTTHIPHAHYISFSLSFV